MSNGDSLIIVRALGDVAELSGATSEIQVMDVLDDEMALALTRLPRLRVLWQAGNSRITDSGVRDLASLSDLEDLDLEWSGAITDAALDVLATFPRLRSVDLAFCAGLTAAGLARLQQACPTLKIETDHKIDAGAMDIALYPPMLPSRPCHFCLSLQRDSVFADFDVDPDGRVFAVRVSFDGYGCCHAPADVGRMSVRDSEALLAMVEQGSVPAGAAQVLRSYFQKNRDALWADALEHHDLL